MKVFLDSIGCRLNQSEIERFAARFRAVGHELVADPAVADLIVVNTCAVTAAASADSRSRIRWAARAGTAKIVATGCYATIEPEYVANLPSVDLLIPNNEKDHLVALALGINENDPIKFYSRMPLPGQHKRTRAFIKVQDGCDNFCTFCITRIARGAHRSQPESEILNDIELALNGGTKEIVLSGVDLGAWGKELIPKRTLASLITNIVEIYSPHRIRLSSLEPWDITDEFLEVMGLPGFCQHLHLPLQSGSDAVLQRMGRRSSAGDFESLIERVRQKNPEMAITTDLMVGFPGESEQEFRTSLEFVRSINFAGGHVFSYSSRQGTAAERMTGQVPSKVKKIRSAEIRNLFSGSAKNYRELFVGRELNVLWERSIKENGAWKVSGLSDNYIRVEARSVQNQYNQVTKARIIGLNDQGLLADDLYK
jgi:threonylcarbamoyladenosine tRNA methylthiotransferase MtaB